MEPTVCKPEVTVFGNKIWSTLKSRYVFAPVLSWDGEVSAVSRDAIEDVRSAMCDTVIDEWDEDFDRGKVRKELREISVVQWLLKVYTPRHD